MKFEEVINLDLQTKSELESIKIELQSIINELNNIGLGVRADFTGIGNENCAKSIMKTRDQCQWVKRQFDNID